MKKCLGLLLLISGYAIADSSFDINKAGNFLNCGNYKITSASTESDVAKGCKVLKSKTEDELLSGKETKLTVALDGGLVAKCKFDTKTGKLKKCKLHD